MLYCIRDASLNIELHIQPYIDILINQADQKCDLKNEFGQFVTVILIFLFNTKSKDLVA